MAVIASFNNIFGDYFVGILREIMGRKGKKTKGRGKQADRGGTVSQTHSPSSSALGLEGSGQGTGEGYFSGVEEDESDKSLVFDVVEGQKKASSSPRSPTPPPEDLPAKKGVARPKPEPDTKQSMVDVFFYLLIAIICISVQTVVCEYCVPPLHMLT